MTVYKLVVRARVGSLLALLSLASAQAAPDGPQPAADLLQKPASINLKSILQHQEALEVECAKYHERQVRRLEYLSAMSNNAAEPGPLQLPEPLPVQVPAVCLFLFSQFAGAKPAKTRPHHSKLELVNWIYGSGDEDEDAGQKDASLSPRQKPDEDRNEMLAEYLFDPAASESGPNEHEIGNQESTNKLQHNIETMLADERFQQLVERNRQSMAGYLSPVILVPGLLGSRLQARTSKAKRINIFCSKQTDWQDVWLSVKQLLPFVVDCWLDNVRLEYEPETGFSRPPPGVETRVPDFGSVESVRHLDLRQPRMTRYFHELIERYQQLGYTPDQNLFAAPYDFRLAPQELDSFFADLRALIERAQLESSHAKKVTLVCHSMGCTHLLVFLRQQSAAWRQKRIRKLVALSSPWGGAIKALKALITGDQLNLPVVSETKMRKLARTYPSISYLLPQPEVFARIARNNAESTGPVLVSTPERQYRLAELDGLMRDLNLTRQLDWFKSSSSLIRPLEPLADLHVDCIHSLNVPTPETLLFERQVDFPNGEYQLVRGEGDGTVNYESLMVCEYWSKLLPDKVKHKIIMNTNHVGVLSHKTTLFHLTNDALTH